MVSPNGTIIVTGAAGGIGSGFVSEFLKTPQALTHHAIYIHHPSAPGSLSTLLSTKAPLGHKYDILPVDLSTFAEIRKFAASINERVGSGSLPPVTGLLLIAGGIFTSSESEDGINYTADGLEMIFAVNYLANFLLVLLLLGAMDKEGGARVVFMSSTTHDPKHPGNTIHLKKEEHKIMWREAEVLAKGTQEKVPKGEMFAAAMRRYGTSKFCMNLWMYEIQNRLLQDSALSKISIIAMDPGAVGGTDLYHPQTFPPWLYFILKYLIVPVQKIACWLFPKGPLRTAEQVGRDLIFATCDEKTLGENPRAVYLDGTVLKESSPETRDVQKQAALWKGSLQVVGLKDEETVLGAWK